MSEYKTPQERAQRVLELDQQATCDPWHCRQEGIDWRVSSDGFEIADVFDNAVAKDAHFIAETRTLAPVLARDVLAQQELLRDILPYAAHIPGIADRAHALGITTQTPDVRQLREAGLV